MTKIMTPSDPITPGQIAKFLDLQAAALRKSGLPGGHVQSVLESQGAALADEFVAAVRKHVEMISDLITRRVKVDRSRAPEAALAATDRRQYTNANVVASMPRGEGEEADMIFFKLDRYVSDAELEKEYVRRGLVPADPFALAAVNEADPTFADDRPNATHWKDADGKWCYAAFDRWYGVRCVNVYRDDLYWRGNWWFAGRRK